MPHGMCPTVEWLLKDQPLQHEHCLLQSHRARYHLGWRSICSYHGRRQGGLGGSAEPPLKNYNIYDYVYCPPSPTPVVYMPSDIGVIIMEN